MRICQRWPVKGPLKENMNKSLEYIRELLSKEKTPLYAYVLTTVKVIDGHLVQTGSAPNFQGGVITLCTCKHYMRTWRTPEEWKGIWIAGFTGNVLKDGKNYLFYLMKVQEAFMSHRDLWRWLPPSAREAKNARFNECGDVFEPKKDSAEPYNPLEYYPPCNEHVHAKRDLWHKDIDYINRKTKRRPALLAGNPHQSYLWSKPVIYLKGHPRTKKWEFEDFIGSLRERSCHKNSAKSSLSSSCH